MYVKQFVTVTALAVVTGLVASPVPASITIPTVPVGNPGNASDPSTGSLYGSVAAAYNIGATEVTNAQYAAFLNAVAATDTNALYNTNMADSFGGITRSGVSGSYTYQAISGRESNPVNYVSFWDSTRFANWLHNGQPSGPQDNSTTESGAYTLSADGIAANTITRNAGWQWAVTSEDEWYKAAYHQPASAGGDSDDYWLYPTSSNTITAAQANYDNLIGNTTPVGSYAPNFYGAFDMGGNVFEWNEAIPDRPDLDGPLRGIRGGSFMGSASLRADNRGDDDPTNEINIIGFRVSQVPGPS
ncbi:MAG TPA: SUMF1/EgtB/PvdO family nonheme iron enzyme, partial [Phycisphaerales bacterium]|nr:SUMF1/EgtB/PvdO family nonheme iron enzyme [Phycisphaerales bacterium]